MPPDELLVQFRLPEDSDFVIERSALRAFSLLSNRGSWILSSMYISRYGLNVIGWRILAILATNSPLSAKDIAEMLATDQVTISRATEQLANKNLIRRRVDPKDRRRQLLRLSKRGTDIYNQILPLLFATENAILSPLSTDERREFMRMLSIVQDHSDETVREGTNWEHIIGEYGYREENLR